MGINKKTAIKENMVLKGYTEATNDSNPQTISTLINGDFMPFAQITGNDIPPQPGIYCIKLTTDGELPAKFGTLNEHRILYIGIASSSLKERLWDEELHDKLPATFFRSIGAMLGFLPPKGSLVGKSNTRNYRFSPTDKKEIQAWMHQNLSVNFIVLPSMGLAEIEKGLIKKLKPFVNIQHNPCASKELRNARKKCIAWANTRP